MEAPDPRGLGSIARRPTRTPPDPGASSYSARRYIQRSGKPLQWKARGRTEAQLPPDGGVQLSVSTMV
ncbi:hypothetical protein PYCCODRAFT_1431726 [Trametes coccinea BRFM310]|uniref:Uncharacterized protein n=1 Tax=Trametes coccinea (strain BRFM310) TaxID=1353009 RepID=A0A1Y2IXL5_TRAC3|nr:hypothetical protein PYCCODRAFT_1431726 [Trametes coccinea BRFM310]